MGTGNGYTPRGGDNYCFCYGYCSGQGESGTVGVGGYTHD